MPFYRQIKRLVRLGMNGLKEVTIVGCFKRTMEPLRPLYDILVKDIQNIYTQYENGLCLYALMLNYDDAVLKQKQNELFRKYHVLE